MFGCFVAGSLLLAELGFGYVTCLELVLLTLAGCFRGLLRDLVVPYGTCRGILTC